MGFLGIGDDGSGKIKDLMNENKRLIEAVDLPELGFSEYLPEMYSNEAVGYETIGEDPLVRSAQLKALERMSGLADTGFSDVDEAAMAESIDAANQMTKGNRMAALQNAQARGVAGGGLEFALGEMANQAAAEQAKKQMIAKNAETARMRALQNQALMSGLTNMRGDDYRSNSANIDIINRFNQLNTGNRNQTNMLNTQQRNDAFRYNQDKRNEIANQNFNNELKKVGAISGANDQLSQYHAAEGNKQSGQLGAIGSIGGAVIGGMYDGYDGASAGAAIGGQVGKMV